MKRSEFIKLARAAMARREEVIGDPSGDEYGIHLDNFESVAESIFDEIFPFHDDSKDENLTFVAPEPNKVMNFEDWQEENHEELTAVFAETGQDREMDFDLEKSLEEEYEKYLKKHES
jgi:hypothetical protein